MMEKSRESNNGKITTMIIDDEAHCIESLKELLQQENRVRIVATESDPQRAITQAIALRPDLLLKKTGIEGKIRQGWYV